jgi:hypothetical protein
MISKIATSKQISDLHAPLIHALLLNEITNNLIIHSCCHPVN